MSIQRPSFYPPAYQPITQPVAPPSGVVPSSGGKPATPPVRPVMPAWRPGTPNLGPRYLPLSMMSPEQLASFKQEEAIRLADRFCRASLFRLGADEHDMKVTLKQVAREGLQPTFNIAVRNLALQHGKLVRDAGEVVDDELGGNFLTRFFKAAPRKACHEYLALGRNTHSSTPWEYRRYGMYRSGSDFVGLIKRHPAISLSVIAAVSYLGDKFPFVGAASGLALMGWAAVVSAISEYKASKFPYMNSQKAGFYEKSGENLAAIFLTLPGYHGITEGMRGGIGIYKDTLKARKAESILAKHPKSFWNATKLDKESKEYKNLSEGKPANAARKESEESEGSRQSRIRYTLNRALFVAGLFDNVLLPFNWLADKLEDKD